jgi:Tfp pilus assembly protein PilF
VAQARHLLQADSARTALDLLDSLVAENPDFAEGHIARYDCLIHLADSTAAEAALTAALETAPWSKSAQSRRVRLYISRGQPDQAREGIARLLQLNAHDPTALLLQGELFQSLDHPDSASASYQQAVESLLTKKGYLP